MMLLSINNYTFALILSYMPVNTKTLGISTILLPAAPGKLKALFLFLDSLLLSAVAFSQPILVSDRIKINQLGYYTNAPKVAVITGTTDAATFFITTTNTRDTLFSGSMSN